MPYNIYIESMSILYKIKRWKVKWGRSKEKDLELDELQKKTYDIVIKLINDKDSTLMLDVTGRKCIKNKDIWVTIIRNNITIINGADYCKDYVDDRTRDSISEKFNNKLCRKINALANQSMSLVKNNLDSVLQSISEPTKPSNSNKD